MTFRLSRNILLCVLLVAFFSACSSKKKVTKPSSGTSGSVFHQNNKAIEKEVNRQTKGNFVTYTPQTYIERFKGIAVTEMNKYGIPASITLAQGILESGNGNSDLARYANNHFGIKCTSDWRGKGYYKDDDAKDDCFRVYSNPDESYRDHSEFLKRKRYAFLFELDKDDYKGWAQGLKQAGYATNPRYPDLLISIIERYKLNEYDRKEGRVEKIKREDKVLADINKNISKEAVKDKPVEAPPAIEGDYYIVVKGDTPYSLSKRFGLTVDELLQMNNITDGTIKLGQRLLIKKSGNTDNYYNGGKVPVYNPMIYTVAPGDTLYSIAKRFNVSVDDLIKLNYLTDNNIKVGQELIIKK
ncbi:glucosaminidase domain-containing protein [Pseudopedobacter beijingensis]|uniref:Peptidoglycan hydrolase n=1 Tax=Pseudopedobacter beijingensis TaxID=1207056 RepID=A0ABW4IB14_9SPHI